MGASVHQITRGPISTRASRKRFLHRTLFLPPIEAPAQSDVARSVHAYLDAHTNQMLALLEALVGHCDTVWPLGTLAEVPFEVNGNVVRGPGVFDRKGGPVQMMFVLAALRAACVEPAVVPIVFINSCAERGRGAQCPL